MEERILEIMNKVLTNRNKPIITELNPRHNLRNDIGFDSLDLAELTVKVEDAYDVDIFANGIIQTVEEILNQIVDE